MKKILKVFLLSLCLVISACGKEISVEQARQALSKHLIERYGEEFEIGYMGRRSDGKDTWYQAEIYPSKFNGTPKQYDKYYHRFGTVDIKKSLLGEEIKSIGDTYRIVLMNESANNFYLPKLKELFGENVLPVLDINIGELSIYPDFITEIKERLKNGGHPQIKGGIYIFGRVESDEDREWYREQIFKFLTFMKETGTFEYVDLSIMVVDDRELISNPRKLLENLPNNLSDNEWRKQRRQLMKAGNEEFRNMTQKEITAKINSINKAKYLKSGYGGLLYIKIYSPNYIKVQGLDNHEVREYNSISDVKFDWEMW